ncbi:MAG: homoserine kinase [Bacteroidales bacterium]|jgi:homoserine kinase|nr:homoserine kinase [Bacteroidales bacterium]
MKKVRVFAPASIANLGCGFDIMGLALDEVGDILEMSASEGDGIHIENRSGVPLPEDPEENVVTPVIRKFFEMTGLRGRIDVTVCQKIYPGSGIGSSAASSAAAAFGMNALFDEPLSDEDLVVCAMEGENLASGGYHADNAAPSLLGGIILIRGYEPLDIIQLPIPGNFYCAVVHPRIMVSTKAARGILPKAVPMHDAIGQWGNVGGLIAGLYSGNIGLVGRSMQDFVAEPYRKRFIPDFDGLRTKILASGSLAMNISGSGPSVFSLSDKRETAHRAGELMKEHFAARDIPCDVYVVKITNKGTRLLANEIL